MLQTQDVLRVLRGVKRNGRGCIARCPVPSHGQGMGDRNPSLTITDANGKALIHCKGGCNQDAVIREIKALLANNLFGSDASSGAEPGRAVNVHGGGQFTMDEVTEFSKQLASNSDALDWLSARYISTEVAQRLQFGYKPRQYFRGKDCKPDCPHCGERPALVIPAIFNNKVIGLKYRALKPPDGAHKWSMQTGSTTKFIYYADLERNLSTEVIVAEGPLDAAMLLSQGYNAVALASASGLPSNQPWPMFYQGIESIKKNYRHILCVGDQGPEGRDAMDRLAKIIGPGAARWPLMRGGAKDVTELIQKYGPGEFKRDMDFLLDCARRRRPVPQHETPAEQVDRIAGDFWFLIRHLPDAVRAAGIIISELKPIVESQPTGTSELPPFPEEAMIGTLGELAHVLTAGTLIPPHFAFMSLLTIVGLYCSGDLKYGHEYIQSRFYLCLIGERGRTRKSTAVARAWDALRPLVDDLILPLRSIGSGEALAEKFSDRNRVLLLVDELKSLTAKMAIQNASLGQKTLELFEANHIAHITQGNKVEHDNAHLAIVTSSTPRGFEDAWVGTGADEGGLLSRFVIEYAEAIAQKRFSLSSPDPDKVREIRQVLEKQLAGLPLELGIDPDADEALERWWMEREETPRDARLDGYAKRVAMVLALTSGKKTIDLEVAHAAIALAERQSLLRDELFPSDAQNVVERFEQKIIAALKKKAPQSERDLVKATNAHRDGSGGVGNFNRALTNLKMAKTVVNAGRNAKGSDLYTLAVD